MISFSSPLPLPNPSSAELADQSQRTFSPDAQLSTGVTSSPHLPERPLLLRPLSLLSFQQVLRHLSILPLIFWLRRLSPQPLQQQPGPPFWLPSLATTCHPFLVVVVGSAHHLPFAQP
eukprot:TRINITY_DN19098_c0_g1_i1.p1 TRINITY_DN19098_c0_g1~~TRINITY_DN19098_c0_g1_i1.p1  ORF type:complete len:118 (-),score=6.47 TRINITY_DN19098_c0_g1_i1:173-526(-)